MADADPEQTFFEDPALDRALAMIMALAAELAVTKDRLRSLEVVLEKAGTINAGVLDAYIPEQAEAAALGVDRNAMVQQLMDAAKGTQASRGARADNEERFA
jgi:nitrogen fixation/metabolism regulation signal transduction histidine kinase